MTKPSETEFAVHISGITYGDAVALCGKRFAKALSDWHSDEDPISPDAGRISIPVANIREAMAIFAKIEEADDWAESCEEWHVQLQATRIMSTYSLGATLTETGCDLQMIPWAVACRPEEVQQ